MIYLDNAATTKMHPEVLDAMLPYLKDEYGNAGTLYGLGERAAEAVDQARRQVAKMIGARTNQIFFTSGGTESNNMVFRSIADYLKFDERTTILTSAVEHNSVIRSSQYLEQLGFTVKRVGVHKNGRIDMDELLRMWTPDVGLVSVMYENNELGSVNDVKKIGEIASDKYTFFHTDCVQAAGWHRINVREIGCDFLSISSHKIHGCKGVGTLYYEGDKQLLRPLIFGGAAQEFGFRGGTENVAGIVGFGKACEMAAANYPKTREACKLGEIIAETLHSSWGSSGWRALSEIGRSKILSLCFEDISAETLMLNLSEMGVCVSAGSACRTREMKPSHVLKAIGLSDEEAAATVRISFSILNTKEEAEEAARCIVKCVDEIRKNQ